MYGLTSPITFEGKGCLYNRGMKRLQKQKITSEAYLELLLASQVALPCPSPSRSTDTPNLLWVVERCDMEATGSLRPDGP